MMGRKKRSRAGSAVLTLILTAACAVTVFAEPLSPQRHVELNEEGSFSQNRMLIRRKGRRLRMSPSQV